MRRIAIINQKGGVGKTTTAVNLAAALAESGQRVCLLDLDPQAHATTHLGIEPDGKAPSMYDVLVNSRPIAEVRRKVSDNLWVASSDINLAAAEVELAGVVGREVILRDLLLQEEGAFDFVLMDCAPSLGVLTLNALSAANEVFPCDGSRSSTKRAASARPRPPSTWRPHWPTAVKGSASWTSTRRPTPPPTSASNPTARPFRSTTC